MEKESAHGPNELPLKVEDNSSVYPHIIEGEIVRGYTKKLSKLSSQILTANGGDTLFPEFTIYIKQGDKPIPPEDIQRLLDALNDLHIANGGDGLKFRPLSEDELKDQLKLKSKD